MTERVVLAYSGGVDTSGVGWIAEETGAEVIASPQEYCLPAIKANALASTGPTSTSPATSG